MILAKYLAKYFGTFPAVSDVTLEARPGEIIVLLGPNGAGKTTTIRMLAAILRPSKGQAIVAGYDVARNPIAVRHHVGLLTELPGLYDRMKAIEYLDFFGALQGMAELTRRTRIETLLKRFELWEARNLPLGDYSKGMRQKVSLVRALLHDAPVLLLDEPTSAMDPTSARQVRDFILEMKGSERTLLVCTHNLAEAEQLADRIAIIRLGRMIVFDTPANLRRQLLGPPQMEVRLAGPCDGLVEVLQAEVGVTARPCGETCLRYETTTPEQTNPRVLHLLADLGAQVVTLSEVRRSLEEVYLQIVSSGEEAVSEAGALLRRREASSPARSAEPQEAKEGAR